jgi:hypothetical protein
VNGHAKRFILDSGASVTIVSERCARELGLAMSGTRELTNAGNGENKTRVSSVKNLSVALAGLPIVSGKGLAVSLEAYESQEGRPVDGVLGFELFEKRVVSIDYPNRIVRLYDPKTYVYSGKSSDIPLRIAGLAFVQAKLEYGNRDTSDAEFSIDTGSQSAVQLNRPFAERHPLPASKKTIDDMGTGVGGEYARKLGRLESLRIGDVLVGHPVASFSQAANGASANPKFDGSIGSELLRRFSVILDYPHKRLILEPAAEPNSPFEADMSGLHLTASGSDFRAIVVRRVFEGSPAALAGVREGDILVEVNGKPAAELDLPELRRMLKLDGQSVAFKIRRGSQSLELGFKLSRRI